MTTQSQAAQHLQPVDAPVAVVVQNLEQQLAINDQINRCVNGL